VQAGSVFEAAASGVARFRDEGWIDTLGRNAVIRVEVRLPPGRFSRQGAAERYA
jgi:hypothetical protein